MGLTLCTLVFVYTRSVCVCVHVCVFMEGVSVSLCV